MNTILHCVVGYFVLLLTVRALTRRPGAQMTLFEFVIVFLMGGVIIASTLGNDKSITNCVCAVIAVAGLHRLVSGMKSRSARFGAFVDGVPLVLRKHGEWQEKVMHGMRIDKEDVLASARTKGIRGEDEIDWAILERNGGISVLEKEQI